MYLELSIKQISQVMGVFSGSGVRLGSGLNNQQDSSLRLRRIFITRMGVKSLFLTKRKASVRHWVNYKKCNKGGQATFNNTKFFRKEISGIIQHWLLFIQKNY